MTDQSNSARQERLRAALRENLKRRKGQLRGRREQNQPQNDGETAVDTADLSGAAPDKPAT